MAEAQDIPAAKLRPEASVTAPSTAGSGLPPELERFLDDPSPKSLVIRGPPGSGKTSLALTALDAFVGQKIFITSSVPRDELLHQFSWVRTAGPDSIGILEFLRFGRPAQAGDRALTVDDLREALQARASDLIDLANVLSLPRSLEAPLASESHPRKMVVIDSWDAWIENRIGPTALAFDVPTTRWELERTILGQLLRTGAHVLLVAERSEVGRLEYVVDGALSLSVAADEGRQERWIGMSKLRGTRIENATYPFTLEGGRFRAVLPLPSGPRAWQYGCATDPNPSDPWLWPGSDSYARWFGRLPPAGYTLVEADNETPERALWFVLAPMVRSVLRRGGSVALQAPLVLTPTEIRESLSPDGRDEPGGGLLHLLPSESAHVGSALDTRTAMQEFLERTVGRPAPVLVMLFRPDTDGADPGAISPVELIREAHAELKPDRGAFGAVVVARDDDPQVGMLRAQSATHLAVRSLRGRLFLHGIRPWTALLVPSAAPAPDDDAEPYRLVPIL